MSRHSCSQATSEAKTSASKAAKLAALHSCSCGDDGLLTSLLDCQRLLFAASRFPLPLLRITCVLFAGSFHA